MAASFVSSLPTRVWEKALNQKKSPIRFKTLLICSVIYAAACLIGLGFSIYDERAKEAIFSLLAFTIFSGAILTTSLYMSARTERILSRAQESLAGMLSIFPCLVTDRHKNIIFANKLLRTKFPLIQQENFSYVTGNILEDDQRTAFINDIETGLKGVSSFSALATFSTPDMAHEDIFVSVVPLSEDGLFLWRFLSMDDFRQRFFQKSFKDNGFLSSLDLVDIFNAAPAGDLLLDKNGIIHNVNKSFRDLFSDDKDHLTGLPFTDLVTESDKESIEKLLERSQKSKPGTERDYQEFAFKNGHDAVVYAAPFQYPSFEESNKKDTGFFLQVFDNKERKEIQSRVLKSQKTQALGQLAGGVAHDFNNLLTAMIGFCDLLLLRHSPSDQSFTDVMQIKQNANRAANLVRQLLAFSRQQTLQPRVMDITDVLEDVSLLLQRLIGSSIRLSIIHGRELGPVKVDRGQFEQVIINLVVNARDALAGEGEILIQTKQMHFKSDHQTAHDVIKTGDYIRLSVTDTGQGIDPTFIDKIFDPFFSTKEVGSGTGLGLATVQGIINQTGGHITVDSTPKKGTTFHIYLPLFEGEKENKGPLDEDALEKKVISKDLTGSGTILLVEDEDAVRLFSARALRDKGYSVVEATTGEEALSYLTTLWESGHKTVDLLVTDVVMPIMDGPTLVKRAHDLFPDLKVVFISGYAEETFREKLEEDDILFLPKPYSLKALASIVKAAFGEKDGLPALLRHVG